MSAGDSYDGSLGFSRLNAACCLGLRMGGCSCVFSVAGLSLWVAENLALSIKRSVFDMLRSQAFSALRWVASEEVASQVLFFGVSLVLARLVVPEAHGTVALLSLFTGVAAIFVDGGLSAALVQRKEITRIDESTVFWFSLGTGLLIAVALAVGAPWIASFYGVAVIIPIAHLYALQIVIGALGSVHYALFQRNLDFRTPFKIRLASYLLSSLVGIFLAWRGYGIWALVAHGMGVTVLGALLTWTLSPWRPLFCFRWESFRKLFSFGGYLFLTNLLGMICSRFHTIIIGKLFGVRELGIYNRADATKQLPSAALAGSINRIAFPLFSRAAGDPQRVRRGFKIAIRGVMFLNVPMMIGIACVAEPLIVTLFGAGWAEAAPLLEILALAGILWPLHVMNLNVLKAMGHSGKIFKMELVNKFVEVGLIVAGSRFGLPGMAWGVALSSVVTFVFNAYYNGMHLDYGAVKQALDIAPSALCAAAMGGIVLAFEGLLALPAPLELVTLAALGGVVYVSFVFLFRIPEALQAVAMIRRLLNRQRGSAGNI